MINVLILSRDHTWLGGVVNFIESLKLHFSPEINWVPIKIGQRVNKKFRLLSFLMPIIDTLYLIFRIKNRRFDLIHINPSLNLKSLLRDGLFIISLKLFGSQNLIIFFHGWDEKTETMIKKNSLIRFIFICILERTKAVLVLASKFKESLVDMGLDKLKIHVFSTMFDGGVFDDVHRKKEGLNRNILFLSRLVREKGIYELLMAFKYIVHDFPNAKLLIAGDGPEFQNLETWINDNMMSQCIYLTGYLRGADKAQFLLDGDLFVFPTYHGEGCPVALLEAMAAGLPIITTPVGGIPDIFKDNENGILIDPVTPKNITKAIVRMFIDTPFREKVIKNNRRWAWENFEANIVTKKLEDFYIKILSK